MPSLFLCLDIDECAMNICSEHAACNNTEGSFNCSCNIGYHGDGFNCSGEFSDYCFADSIVVHITFFDAIIRQLFGSVAKYLNSTG